MSTVIQGNSATVITVGIQGPAGPEGPQGPAGVGQSTTIFTQETQPGSTTDGDGWFNTLTGTFSVYSDGEWRPQTVDGQNF